MAHFALTVYRISELTSSFFVGDVNAHLIRVAPELMRMPNKFQGKTFSFFNSEKTFDSNLFSILTKERPNGKKRRGIGFGGATQDTCKVWLDHEMSSQSFVTFNNLDSYDGCLLFSIDRLMRKLCHEVNHPKTSGHKPSYVSGRDSENQSLFSPKDIIDSFSQKNAQQCCNNRLDIEVLSVEVWSIMNAESFERFNDKLDELLDSNHYDKMVEQNCSKGTKDAETLMEYLNEFSLSK